MSDWSPKRVIGMLPRQAARRWGKREALVFKGNRWTHAQFDFEVDRVAKVLIAAGVERREHVAMWITNRPEFLFLFYAIIKIGAVAVPLNTRLRTLDIGYALRQSRSKTLIAVSKSGPIDYESMILDALKCEELQPSGRVRSPICPDLRRLIIIDGECGLPWTEFLKGSVDEGLLRSWSEAVDPAEMAMIMYTSGTTGYPKGVMLNHGIVQRSIGRAAILGITPADVQLNYLPLFHMYSLAYVALHCVLSRAKQVLTETFDPEESLHLIESERATTVHGFDTHYRALMDAKTRNPSVDTRSLRFGHFTTGLENSVAVAIETQTKLCPTVAGYGSTETGSGFTQTVLDANLDQRTRASGYPLPDSEVLIVDPATGCEAAVGVQGEIWVRSELNMLGYYDDPDATAATIDADGWLHTGDAGVVREDGHVRFVGRYKDMLKVGGENVSPAEIEHLLLQAPGVAEVAIVGCPDPILHETPTAFIVARGGSAVTLASVDRFCRGKIASYKIPRRVIVLDGLPMTSSGKVQKHLLRQALLLGPISFDPHNHDGDKISDWFSGSPS